MRKKRIGFIGLGNMGKRIAACLTKAGYGLTVFDLWPEAVRELVSSNRNATGSDSVRELFASSDIVFLSLPSSVEVEKVTTEGMQTELKGKIIIDLSTSQPDSTRRLSSRLQKHGCVFIDAPLTGGPKQAEKGELNVIVAGDKLAYKKVLPLLQAFGKNIFYAGSSGNGHMIKLINNSLSGVYVCLYAEILPLIRQFNIQPELFSRIISVSGGNSPMFQTFAPKMLNRDFSRMFTIELMDKDFSYVEKLLGETGSSGGILKAARTLCNRAKENGMGKEDISSLIKITSRKK